MVSNRKRIRIFDAANIPKIYQNIFQSYHNQSDLLAELLQNAVDSVRMSNSDNPLIEIKFDQKNKVLTVKDNGIGMMVDELEDFAPGRTKKSSSGFSFLGGEKGIGTSFIFGGSDKFYIETCKDGRLTIAECLGAHDAILNNKEPDFFILEEEANERMPNYTELQVTGNLFYLDFKNRDEIEQLVRTFTAVGYTLPLFGMEGLDIKVKLTWVDEKGEEASKHIKNLFRHPVIDHGEMVVDYSEAENIDTGFDLFLKYVDEQNQAIGIFGESDLFKRMDLPTGVMLSVKGYPTVVEITPPKTGYAGYWSRNMLVVVNKDDVVLDPGRKSVRSEDRAAARDVAKNIFNKLTKYHKKFIRQTEAEAEKAVLDSLKEQARDLEDLRIEGIAYRKRPDYEQGVIAIFHEMLGAGIIKGYSPLSASSDTRYDEIMYYEVPLEEIGETYRQKFLETRRNVRDKSPTYKQLITVEYKLNVIEIMRDVKKDLRLINLLVAYDFDRSKLKPQWKWIELNASDIVFKGAKYQIRNPMNDSCYVLLLKDFETG
jgi:Histidine kinase-, DNA gyrase B-, and HSP90-like ATPase